MAVRIKRYEGEAEALDALLDRIEREMGPEALLETREYVKGGVLGVGGKRMVEIIATLEVDSPAGHGALAREPSAAAASEARQGIDIRAAEPSLPPLALQRQSDPPAPRPRAPLPPDPPPNLHLIGAAPAAPAVAADTAALKGEFEALRSGLAELRQSISALAQGQAGIKALAQQAASTATRAVEAVESLTPRSGNGHAAGDGGAGLSPVQQAVLAHLLGWNIERADALELLCAVAAPGAEIVNRPGQPPLKLGEESLLALVSREICRGILLAGAITPPEPGQGPKVIALVGPTGVGKTTTIAKLAAQLSFNQGKRVALLCLDNYRIAAAEQIRTYAEIIGIPLDIVFSADEYARALAAPRKLDYVFIDTAGRSPLNTAQVGELAQVFAQRPPDETHLLISATTKSDDLAGILEGFAPLNYSRIIVSKLDETRSLGCIYNLNKLAQVPISYFAVGQSVPDDLRAAELAFIQGWIEQGRIR